MSNNKSVHILHSTKRRFVSSDEITATGNNDTFIGALPPNIITKIPFDSRGTITKQTDNIFSNFASAVSHLSVFKYVPYSFNSGYFEKYCSQAVQELNAVFNTTDTDISYIGSGEYKHCFMINFEQDSKNSYVLQAFQNIMYCDLYHGVKFEPQNYFTAYKQYSHGRIAKPFMAHLSNKEFLPNGYILTKYIDVNHDRKTPLGKFTTNQTRISHSDNELSHNSIRGIIIDIGGIKENPERIADTQIRKYYYELAQILDSLNFLPINNTFHERLDKKYTKHGEKFFDTKMWPKFTRRIKDSEYEKAKQTLRLLRHLKIKCDQLKDHPDWETIQKQIKLNTTKNVVGSDYMVKILQKILFETKDLNNR